MIDAGELELLRASAINHGGDARVLEVTVSSCAYSCCGRGWLRRDGYEQVYRGWIDNLHIPRLKQDDRVLDDEEFQGFGDFMLYSAGIGTLSYVCAIRFDEVEYIAT